MKNVVYNLKPGHSMYELPTFVSFFHGFLTSALYNSTCSLTLTIWLAFPFALPLESSPFTQFSSTNLAFPSVLAYPSPEAAEHSNLTGI